MPLLRIDPLGIELQTLDGETVMEAALRCGYRWPTVCHGDGTCTVCWIKVIGADSCLSVATAAEKETLEQLPARLHQSTVRLACQAKVLSDAQVEKRGVRPDA